MPSASARFDTAPAPVDALLAQELINTKRPGDAPFDDLLADRDGAQRWLDELLDRWEAESGGAPVRARIDDRDLAELRELRDTVEASVDPDGEQRRALRGGLEATARGGSGVAVGPTSTAPAPWLETAILLGRMRAELLGEWGRLKLCANPACKVAFYDRSRNRAGVWHNVERCGNKINLRNLRARRAAAV